MATNKRTRRPRGSGSIRQLKNGYQARYLDPTGITRTAPQLFPTRAAADSWLAAIRTDIHRGQWHAPDLGAQQFAEFITEWLASPPKPLRPRTRLLYEGLAKSYLLSDVGGINLGQHRLDRITPTLVRQWYAAMKNRPQPQRQRQLREHPARIWARSEGIAVPPTGRLPVAVLTAWHESGCAVPVVARSTAATGHTRTAQAYRLLHAVMNTAVREQLILRNPCQLEGARSIDHPRRQAATLHQIDLLANAVPERYRAAVKLAAWSGLRAGEQFALARRHVNLDAGTVTVERQLQELPGQELTYGPPKSSASIRTVVLPRRIALELAEHMRLFTADDPKALVFTTNTGEPVTRGKREQWWNRARRHVPGCEELHWHDLRHTGMTLAAETGAGLPQLMQRLGQATPRAAMIYLHEAEGSQQRLAERLDKRLEEHEAQVLDLDQIRKGRLIS